MRCRVLVAVLVAVVACGCEVHATVAIRVDDGGGGTLAVTTVLDADAVRTAEVAGVPLERAVPLDDLEQAGWRVEPWQRSTDGSAQLVVEHDFTTAAELGPLVAELNGPAGPLRDVELTLDESLLRDSYELTGTADLAAIGTGITTDAELIASLTNQEIDVAALDAALGAEIEQSMRLTVAVDLPGGGDEVVVAPGEVVELDVASTAPHRSRFALLVAGVALGVVAVALVIIGESRTRRASRRARRGTPRAS